MIGSISTKNVKKKAITLRGVIAFRMIIACGVLAEDTQMNFL